MRVAIVAQDPALRRPLTTERVQDRCHMGVGRRLVTGHRHVVVVDTPQVDAVGFGRRDDLVGAARNVRQDGVKVLVVHQLIAECGAMASAWPCTLRAMPVSPSAPW